MSTVNALIPLQANPNAATDTQTKLLTLQRLMQEQQQAASQAQAQNTLKQLFAQPGALDPATGMPTQDAIGKVMQIDPATGMKLRQNMLQQEEQKLRGDVMKTTRFQKMMEIGNEVTESAVNNYDAGLKEGLSPEAAQARAQKIYADGFERLKGSGLATDGEIRAVSPVFDPVASRGRLLTYKERLTMERQDAAQRERERHDRETEDRADRRANLVANPPTKPKWELVTEPAHKDADGNDVPARQYRMDVNSGKTVDLSGKPIEATGAARVGTDKAQAGAAFTPKMAELMGALAEQGVSLPTGFRSKEQQAALYNGILERNPGKSADEIAKMLKTGQIEFGAQKKETQTAAAVAGRVEVAQNEIDEFAPLVRKSAAAVERGKFVPLNRLMQTVDQNISDPNLRALKININSLLNAYDMLAARGGTDMEKRKEVRSLLMSVDSPEVLESALKQFENEAAAAHRAAVKATKVPELENTSDRNTPKPASTAAKATVAPSESSIAVPASLAKDKDGSEYDASDGTIWVKQGDKLVKKAAK